MKRTIGGGLLLCMSMWGYCALAQHPETAKPKPHDPVQDCLRSAWGKPVFWDISAAEPPDPAICGTPADKLDDALKAQHLKAFHLPNAVLLTCDCISTPNRTNLYYRWKPPTLDIRVQALTLPSSRKPTDAELRQISEVILQRSHLVQLASP